MLVGLAAKLPAEKATSAVAVASLISFIVLPQYFTMVIPFGRAYAKWP
jgi:hypothetical protein